ncbi:hypothetical protein LJB87_00375 [Alistipes sp. OttesenSCG-928-L06]|nr:hypothetical protein [Alistipes sp. OttesenSCG-928-L06]
MMKHFTSLLFLSVFVLFSCSDAGSDWEPDGTGTAGKETRSIGVDFDAASLSLFAAADITEVGIFVYLKDSMVFGKNLPLNGGNLQVEVPLGENLETFAVAGFGSLTDTDSLSKVTVWQDMACAREIFISPVTAFISDRSVSSVNLELGRIVGQAVFQPTETAAQLSAATGFDAMDVVFNQVAIGYKPKSKSVILNDVTIPTNLANGYVASVYSFPSPADELGSIEVVYRKGTTEVNRTLRPLDAPIRYESSKRTVVYMPVLNPDYLQQDWTRAVPAGSRQPLKIEEYTF